MRCIGESSGRWVGADAFQGQLFFCRCPGPRPHVHGWLPPRGPPALLKLGRLVEVQVHRRTPAKPERLLLLAAPL